MSLDPGVITFNTYYSNNGKYGKLGHEFYKQLLDIGLKIDDYQSILDIDKNLNKKTKRNIKLKCQKLRNKIKNKVNDLHKKTCNFLCTNFDIILLPTFEVSNMIVKDIERKISSKTVRKMLLLSHYSFKVRLSDMIKQYKNKQLIIVNESYTSKTCGNCGTITNVGGSRTYSCTKCKIVIDRDYNGARNILLRYLTNLANEIIECV